jgi:hypothetical protein
MRAQMRAAKEEALALLRAREAEDAAGDLKEGFKMGFASGLLGGAYAMMFYALYRSAT